MFSSTPTQGCKVTVQVDLKHRILYGQPSIYEPLKYQMEHPGINIFT